MRIRPFRSSPVFIRSLGISESRSEDKLLHTARSKASTFLSDSGNLPFCAKVSRQRRANSHFFDDLYDLSMTPVSLRGSSNFALFMSAGERLGKHNVRAGFCR